MVPRRCKNLDRARRRYGSLVDDYVAAMDRVDPVADAAVAALATMPGQQSRALLDLGLRGGADAVPHASDAIRALIRDTQCAPPWVDWAAVDRGGQVFLRTAMFGAMVLTFHSLVVGYLSPGGTKPLAFSGRLVHHAPRRLTYTGDFVHAISKPGAMHPRAPGHVHTVGIRLTHARVRAAIQRAGTWDAQTWGAPINQADTARTYLLFSLVALDGLRKVGFQFSQREIDDYLHHWRYVGHVLGIDSQLLCTSEAQARNLEEIVRMTQGPADADGRALTRALFDAATATAQTPAQQRRVRRSVRLYEGLARALMGDADADQLGIPDRKVKHLVAALRRLVARIEAVRRRVPGADQAAVALGLGYWERATERGPDGLAAALHPDWRVAGWRAGWLRDKVLGSRRAA